MESIEIETAAQSLERSVVFHVVKEMVGFVLYMHQQIPAILQDLSHEYDTLQEELKSLDLVRTQTNVKASSQRKHIGNMREVKQGIKKLGKLMNSIFSLQTAIQLMLNEIPDIHEIILILGASPLRPKYVYEMCFSCGKSFQGSVNDFSKSKTAETLSRKVIRSLISKGAGSSTYAGPMKLFLLVKAPSTFSLPLHFLPKRDYRYSKKISPFRLCIRCRTHDQDMDASHNDPVASQTASYTSIPDSTGNNLIWFQCKHTIKGLASRTPLEE
ncbi:PREDICTED: uncharacterized protein LOC104599157 [Nelumbo nucifera]|uniref:Uncharacterized protein LOC104599157 n=2 Tax=Nelumbo nucifera TaxID=4432 RepID=A0A1U8A135_NELNU|nr:PREDICTED: uncharacterized protein LOC104599157 [Nelumbo nucifera]DAD27714.1 TPA_asm: hypothetical protein HUJ06_029182 [Nelumbo nucifera]